MCVGSFLLLPRSKPQRYHLSPQALLTQVCSQHAVVVLHHATQQLPVGRGWVCEGEHVDSSGSTSVRRETLPPVLLTGGADRHMQGTGHKQRMQQRRSVT